MTIKRRNTYFVHISLKDKKNTTYLVKCEQDVVAI